MFFIFLLPNYIINNMVSLNNLSFFFNLNKYLLTYFDSFFFNNLFFKRSVFRYKPIKRFSFIKIRNRLKLKKRIVSTYRLKNLKNFTCRFTPFLHNFFLKSAKTVKNNFIFLTHRRVLNFSNFAIFSNAANLGIVYFYLKTAALIKTPFSSRKFIFTRTKGKSPFKSQIKLPLKKLKRNETYRFLENNEYPKNKEKSFLFFNSYYPKFVDLVKKARRKKLRKVARFKIKVAKGLALAVFSKKLKKTTFLFKALFKFHPKWFFKISKLTFSLLKTESRIFLWNDLKLRYRNTWVRKKFKMEKKPFKSFKKLSFNSLRFSLSKRYSNFPSSLPKTIISGTPTNFFFYKSFLGASLLFFSKWKSFFLLQSLGFLFSITSEFTNSNFGQNLANFRKEIYSFTVKNELQKKMLKRYFFSNHIEYFELNFERINIFSSTANKPSTDFFFNYNFSRFFRSGTMRNEKWRNYGIKRAFWSFENIEEMDLTIRRVRFKPGYSIIWREARNTLKANLNINFRYQHRLTKHLLRFRKIVKWGLLITDDANLLNLVVKIKFFPDYVSSLFFLKNNFIFLNYGACSNEKLQIFAGDFIQLVVTCKYYLFYKISITAVFKKKKKLDSMLKKKNFSPTNPEEKQKTHNYPRRILKHKNLLEDVPKFLEVDFYTLSCFVLYEPFLWSDLNPANTILTKFGIINLYNWKYIN